jgi:hypothetical protein
MERALILGHRYNILSDKKKIVILVKTSSCRVSITLYLRTYCFYRTQTVMKVIWKWP